MKLQFKVSPNIRGEQSTKRIMGILMLTLLAVYAFSAYYYYQKFGIDHVIQIFKLLAVSVSVTLLTEAIFAYFVRGKEKFSLQYLKKFLSGSFGLITSLILTLMCPISITPYALGVSTFFAIFFGKLLFGGFGHNIFNPAALGRAIVFATFSGVTTDIMSGATPTGIIANDFNWLVVNPDMIKEMFATVGDLGSLFTGMYSGALGETSVLLLLIIGVILVITKVIDWRLPTFYLATIFICAACIAIMRGVPAYAGLPGFLWYGCLHLFTGGVVFGAVFMLTDPVTTPTSIQGKIIFAIGAAFLTMLIRMKANLPEGCLYAILIMNMLTPVIEKAFVGKQMQLRKKGMVIFASVFVIGIGSVLLAGNAVEAKEPKPLIKVSSSDKDVLKFDARIESSEVLGDQATRYKVLAQGYKSLDDPTKYNEFAITVKDNIVTEMKVVKVVDTEYIGTKIDNEEFLNSFVNMDLSKPVEGVVNDTVSGATFSVKSTYRALNELAKALGY